MNKYLLPVIFFCLTADLFAQPQDIVTLTEKTYMIPMRDGVKLFTVVLSPKIIPNQCPF